MEKIYDKVKPLFIKNFDKEIPEKDLDTINQICLSSETTLEEFLKWYKRYKDVELEQELLFFFRKD